MFVNVTFFVSPALITSIFLLQHDRLRRLLDGERHLDVELLEVTRVGHGHLEREVGRRGDRLSLAAPFGSSLLPSGSAVTEIEGAPVFAAGRPSACCGAVDAQPDLCHRLSARELGVRERCWNRGLRRCR